MGRSNVIEGDSDDEISEVYTFGDNDDDDEVKCEEGTDCIIVVTEGEVCIDDISGTNCTGDTVPGRLFIDSDLPTLVGDTSVGRDSDVLGLDCAVPGLDCDTTEELLDSAVPGLASKEDAVSFISARAVCNSGDVFPILYVFVEASTL